MSSCLRDEQSMNIKTVGVVGAGTMGSGIAQVFAQAGFAVRLVDVARADARSRARDDREEPGEVRREGHADGRRSRRRRSAASQPATALDASPTPTTSSKRSSRTPTPSARCSRASTRSPGPKSILASNTSSISITLLGAATGAARPRARHALHEPGAADDARRADPRPGDVGRIDADRARACARRSARRPSRRPTTPASSPTAS